MKKIAVAVAGALFVTLMPGAAFAQTFEVASVKAAAPRHALS